MFRWLMWAGLSGGLWFVAQPLWANLCAPLMDGGYSNLSKAPLPWHFARVHFARHAAGGLDEEGEELGFA